MSKIGKIPVEIVSGVTISLEDKLIRVTGPKGTLDYTVPNGIEVVIGEGKVTVSQQKGLEATTKALFGLTRALIANMVKGVSEGFEKRLELSGVGYRAQVNGNDLVLSVGFSHPVKIVAPEGIKFTTADNGITVAGMNKVLVGDLAAKIRGIRPPEPYKGKGISYKGEKIRRKAGKAAKAVGTK